MYVKKWPPSKSGKGKRFIKPKLMEIIANREKNECKSWLPISFDTLAIRIGPPTSQWSLLPKTISENAIRVL